MPERTEGAAPLSPFVHVRRVSWADTDAARIAYTARFLDFAVEAIEAWWRDRMGTDWYEMNVDRGIGTPFVHAALDFRSPVTPRDTLATTVRLARLGGSSLRFVVAGCAGRRLVYEGTLVCAFVDAATMRPIGVPAEFRAALEREAALGAG
ncbi:tol-pal system-associated acyl-CoA thioesterase [Caldovatus sediminis]|uniref:Tol-pal system-associated acyl-CoA thioesterase n=1 Tax=Caldovatus sediminis TaxID=2041189 RepID=A0A8J2Z7H6_9PROT|nr:thioesterase family protein [Caldovatus sediminis]GGG17913.1 tol-pal system-associated acyl-CoA thioesterase [Caldovatus sediminis]